MGQRSQSEAKPVKKASARQRRSIKPNKAEKLGLPGLNAAHSGVVAFIESLVLYHLRHIFARRPAPFFKLSAVASSRSSEAIYGGRTKTPPASKRQVLAANS